MDKVKYVRNSDICKKVAQMGYEMGAAVRLSSCPRDVRMLIGIRERGRIVDCYNNETCKMDYYVVWRVNNRNPNNTLLKKIKKL